MEKEKIKERINWACEFMRRHIQENCVNEEICSYMFVAIRLNKENESFHFIDFINLIKKDKLELINGSDLCEQISEEQGSLTWADFTPYRVEKWNVISARLPSRDVSLWAISSRRTKF